MGGRPESLLVTIILPPETKTSWVESLYHGINLCAETHKCSIVGGETSSTLPNSPIVISIAGTGVVLNQNLTLRSTAKPDDLIFVTGTLGGSINGKHLDFKPRLTESFWLTNNFKPSAMMDLSDGIAKDLPRLAAASKAGYKIDFEAIPCNPGISTQSALSDGEDYELLFTIPPKIAPLLIEFWKKEFLHTSLTKIGSITPNTSKNILTGGFEHFIE